MNINPALQEIIAKHFNKGINEIELTSSNETIDDWDSLEHIRLVLQIEAVFKVKFPLEIIPRITSVQSIQIELEKLTNG